EAAEVMERLATVGHRCRLEALEGEELRHHLPQVGVVLDDEHRTGRYRFLRHATIKKCKLCTNLLRVTPVSAARTGDYRATVTRQCPDSERPQLRRSPA